MKPQKPLDPLPVRFLRPRGIVEETHTSWNCSRKGDLGLGCNFACWRGRIGRVLGDELSNAFTLDRHLNTFQSVANNNMAIKAKTKPSVT